MMQFFGQLMKLPLEAFVYSMEMLVQTMGHTTFSLPRHGHDG